MALAARATIPHLSTILTNTIQSVKLFSLYSFLTVTLNCAPYQYHFINVLSAIPQYHHYSTE